MTMHNQPPRSGAEEAFAALLEARLAADPIEGLGGARLGALRRAARDAFARHGLPHRRVEEWKYTDLRAMLRTLPALSVPPAAPVAAQAAMAALDLAGARRILIVDGVLSLQHSDLEDLEPGLSVRALRAALVDGSAGGQKFSTLAPQRYDAPLALNTAVLGEGLVIEVAEGAKIDRPLHVAHVVTGQAPASVFTRHLMDVGVKAEVTLVESFQGPEGCAYVANDALELFVGDGSHVDYLRVQEEGSAAFHLGTLMVDIGRNAALHAFALTIGAAVSRLSVYGRCSGTHSHVAIRGATLAGGAQHADITLLLDHAVAHCESRELFKTVLADDARGVFQGKIVVQRDAQKTDGRMMSQALLLGAAAEMDNKPELEIFADDVQCGHGATAGALDEDLLFYLQARGLPLREAQALLIQAFVGEALEFIEQDDLREGLMARAQSWLAGRAG